MSDLTPKQVLFVDEYLIDLNATQAAIRAGYSENSAKQIGTENLAKPDLQEAIAEAMNERSARMKIDQDRVMQEFARLGLSDMRAFAEWGPDGVTLTTSAELSDDAARCVAEVSETRTKDGGSTVRFKIHPKLPALESLMKHLLEADLDARLKAIEAKLGLACER